LLLLCCLAGVLHVGCRAFKTVVFVIDQVDAFVRVCKQTLLYNVLDALTSSQVQVSGRSTTADTHTTVARLAAAIASQQHQQTVGSSSSRTCTVTCMVLRERAAVSCRAVQAVVFGVSCAYDVQDSMEKRVRSRFSNIKIFLPGLGSAKAGAESAAGVLSSMLLLPDDFQPLNRAKLHNSCVHRALDSQGVKVCVRHGTLRQQS
jgi:hypothetical protein